MSDEITGMTVIGAQVLGPLDIYSCCLNTPKPHVPAAACSAWPDTAAIAAYEYLTTP
jgi:hypothetical protein